MQNKHLWIAVGLTVALMALVFVAGWMTGRPDRHEAPVAAVSTPVDARAVFVPGAGQIDALRQLIHGLHAGPPLNDIAAAADQVQRTVVAKAVQVALHKATERTRIG